MLLRELVRLGPSTASLDVLRKVLDERVDDPDDEIGKDALAGRQASAGIALGRAGRARFAVAFVAASGRSSPANAPDPAAGRGRAEYASFSRTGSRAGR